MAKKEPMTRAVFLAKVERILGQFDSDSYLNGFTQGFDRACDILSEWAEAEMCTDPPCRQRLQARIQMMRKKRR